ncbi:MAG: hypothetical protein E6K77_07510 [Candidatus Eisenbacteria bacterium]|uniref:Uncharacterized protein n=1 Tax=Eiseniibacteriota bacterium TaxID=2212470 RepID=A0A538TFP8_UNCEI|nr:MAG: hypothetical protein E6K77_07510 [Candidatus Eisenbacteria bacterium]
MLPLGLAIAVCVAVVAGCGKKDKIVGPPATPRYPALTSPELVLVALRTAYTGKDSTEYKLLFDQDYLGTSVALRTQSPIDTLTFADEAQHIAALARSTTAIVELQLTPTMTRSRDPGDPPGWALIQNPIYGLTIYDGPNVYGVGVGSETIEFRFIPTPDSTSPTDTTWKIIRWSEIAY